MDGKTQPTRLAALDGLRALAIVLVILHHSAHHLDRSTPALSWIAGALGTGWNGVHLFFVLSGFLVGAIAFREFNETGTLRLFHFWGRRFFRTWPLYFVILGLTILRKPGSELPNLLPYFSFTQNWFRPDFFAHSWSLAVEEQFYLLLPLVLLGLVKIKRPQAGIFLVLGVLGLTYWYRGTHIDGFFSTLHTLTVLDTLVLGVILAWVSVNRPTLFQFFQRFPHLLFFSGLFFLYGPRATNLGFWQTNFFFGGQAIGFSLILLAALSPTFCLKKLLSSFPAKQMALVSYSVYLTHDHAVFYVAQIANKLSLSGWEKLAFFVPTVVLFSWLVGWCTYRAIEAPAMKWRDTYLPKGGAKNLKRSSLQKSPVSA